MPIILDAPPKLWIPEKPAIIRPADPGLIRLSDHNERMEAFVRGASRHRGKRSGRRTFTFVGSCESTSTSLDFSALSAGAVAAGDLLVYIDHATGGALPSAVTPSGFTNHINGTVSASGPTVNGRGMLSSKIATGSEGAITGMTATSLDKIGLVFRPSTPFTTINALGATSNLTGSDPSARTVDPSLETSAVIVVGLAGIASGTAAFSTFSPSADGTVLNSDSDLIAGYKIYNTNPQLTTVDMSDLGGNNWLAAIYFTVT